MIRINVAKGCGFCFGVREAIKKAERAADEYGAIQMLGDIVHNEHVVQDLEKKGVCIVNSIDDIDPEKPLLFRAHGTEKEVVEAVHKKGLMTIDATCPLVLEIHHEIKAMEAEGRKLFIIGDHGHDEVRGIASQVKEATVISTAEEAQALPRMKKTGIVSQSTQMLENFREIAGIIAEKSKDLRAINTICHPTRMNQTEIVRVATNNDLVIVIGSQNSANTKRLAAVAKKYNANTYQVEKVGDIQDYWFKNITTVGISAGASTPDVLIEAVIGQVQFLSERLF